MIYYNEWEPRRAAWLRRLIAAGRLPAGDVDTRSIVEVSGDDLRGYTQCHFFAGVGVLALALRLAGAPVDVPIFTGSCPFHLWPEFRRLIGECRPAMLFGEQVASPLGRAWLAAVRADLEALGYAVVGADLCAAGVGAPHIRQRLYFGARRRGDTYRDGWPRAQGHRTSEKENALRNRQ